MVYSLELHSNTAVCELSKNNRIRLAQWRKVLLHDSFYFHYLKKNFFYIDLTKTTARTWMFYKETQSLLSVVFRFAWHFTYTCCIKPRSRISFTITHGEIICRLVWPWGLIELHFFQMNLTETVNNYLDWGFTWKQRKK